MILSVLLCFTSEILSSFSYSLLSSPLAYHLCCVTRIAPIVIRLSLTFSFHIILYLYITRIHDFYSYRSTHELPMAPMCAGVHYLNLCICFRIRIRIHILKSTVGFHPFDGSSLLARGFLSPCGSLVASLSLARPHLSVSLLGSRLATI